MSCCGAASGRGHIGTTTRLDPRVVRDWLLPWTPSHLLVDDIAQGSRLWRAFAVGEKHERLRLGRASLVGAASGPPILQAAIRGETATILELHSRALTNGESVTCAAPVLPGWCLNFFSVRLCARASAASVVGKRYPGRRRGARPRRYAPRYRGTFRCFAAPCKTVRQADATRMRPVHRSFTTHASAVSPR